MAPDRLALLLGLAALPLGGAGCTATADPASPSGEAQVAGDLAPQGTVPPQLLSPEESARLAFEQAVAAGTNAALILFLAREPQSPWIDEARQRLALRQASDPPGASAIAGPDAEIVESFDAARLSGNPAAWQAFLAQHGSHPLAAEARRLMERG